MKKLKFFTGILGIFLLIFASCEQTILDETTPEIDLKKSTIASHMGFDEWGFNWNAHQFNGYLINMMLGDHYFMGWQHYQQHVYNGEGLEFWNMLVTNYDYFPYLMPIELLDTKLNAHWNDALISKEGVYPAIWVDSDAWIVFKYSGKVGNKNWSHLRKLVASKSTDNLENGIWYNDQWEEIGFESMYWPELIVVQVINTGEIPSFFYDEYRSPWGPGYGKYKVKNQ